MSDGITYLVRDCWATLIPAGTAVQITEGTPVRITQKLGGYYTVEANGNLVRIEGKDAAALGMESVPTDEVAQDTNDAVQDSAITSKTVNEELVWQQLRQCYDPEIPVNIVDLGLVYRCDITASQHVRIVMTLTAPGCGMGEFLAEDVRKGVLQVPNVQGVHVDLTFDPPWRREMMSEAARLETGML